MMTNPRKLLILLVSLAMLALPLRAAWSMADTADIGPGHCEASMAPDTMLAADSKSCCFDAACTQLACDHCSAFSPVAPVSDAWVSVPMIRYLQHPYHSVHTKSQAAPPFRPPRA